MIVVVGNGKSRQNMDLEKIKKNAKVYGCNALYRDFSPDYLYTGDPHVTHEVLSSDYALTNTVVLNNMESIPAMAREGLSFEGKVVENEPTGFEFFCTGWGDYTYITWIKEGSKIMKTPWPDDGVGLSAGLMATRFAHHQFPTDIIYLIGFDIFGKRDNIYDGTNGYPSENYPNEMEKEFIEGFEYLINTYERIKIKRVIEQWTSLKGIPNVPEEELWQNLANNQRI